MVINVSMFITEPQARNVVLAVLENTRPVSGSGLPVCENGLPAPGNGLRVSGRDPPMRGRDKEVLGNGLRVPESGPQA